MLNKSNMSVDISNVCVSKIYLCTVTINIMKLLTDMHALQSCHTA